MFETSLKYGLLLWQLWNANHIVIVSLDWHVMRLFCLYKRYRGHGTGPETDQSTSMHGGENLNHWE